MSSKGPVIDADALRKNVSGTDAGSMPASLTCDTKLVICATTRHGLVTGDNNSSPPTATASTPAVAASIAVRSDNSAAVVVAAVSILAAPFGVLTHQPSAVRNTEMVMRQLLSVGRRGG